MFNIVIPFGSGLSGVGSTGEERMKSYMLFPAVLMLAAGAFAAQAEPSLADLQERIEALEKAGARVPFKFGIVSEGEVLDNLEEKKDVEVDIELLEKEARGQLNALQKEYRDLEAEIQLHAEGSDERKAKEKELEEKKRELTLKYRRLNADIQQEAQKRLDEMRMKIRAHIARYARKHGYALVIEKTALLFGEEGKSLTTEIIDQMNTEYYKAKYEKEKDEAGKEEK